jgi:predicted molibdopterin-dependent oxidoreductase YjgC
MTELAARYARAKSAVFIYSMGLTQYTFGVENVKMVVNLALARGMIGRENCGILPIRGHSGVQGAAECGADADKLPGSVDINDENCERLEQIYQHPIPRRRGLRAGHLLDRCASDGLDVLYLVGGNHLENMPDRKHARRGLENVKLRIHQDIVLNSSTLLNAKEAVLVLPAQTRYEQRGGGTSTSTERRIRFSPEIAGPRLEEARPEWEIPALVGRKLKPERPDLFLFPTSQAVREEMARAMPLYSGIERLTQEGDQFQWGGVRLCSNGFPNMPNGKAVFTAIQLPRVDVPLGKFMLTSRRGKQFNSITYGNSDPLLAGSTRNTVLVDPRDLAQLSLKNGDPITVTSDHGKMSGVVRAAPCVSGHVQAYWPECNVLVRPNYDPNSGEPDYNAVVTLEAQAHV